jgi:hypothetical protein
VSHGCPTCSVSWICSWRFFNSFEKSLVLITSWSVPITCMKLFYHMLCLLFAFLIFHSFCSCTKDIFWWPTSRLISLHFLLCSILVYF